MLSRRRRVTNSCPSIPGACKPSSSVVFLDFLVRHGLLHAQNEPDLLEISTRLHRHLDFPLGYVLLSGDGLDGFLMLTSDKFRDHVGEEPRRPRALDVMASILE